METISLNFIIETVIKWLIPFVCLGIVSIITVKIINPFKKGNKQQELERWEEMAQRSHIHQQLCGKQFEQLRDQAEKTDHEIIKKLDYLEQKIEKNQKQTEQYEKQVEAQLNLLREGVLDSHLVNLIQTCENYIRRGYITPDELDRYKQRLILYHKLGGNGHMDYWDDQINKLPHMDSVNTQTL